MALDWISSQYRCVAGTSRANTGTWFSRPARRREGLTISSHAASRPTTSGLSSICSRSGMPSRYGADEVVATGWVRLPHVCALQMLLFQEHRADIICLQEVIPRCVRLQSPGLLILPPHMFHRHMGRSYISLLVANEYVKANYVLSDVDGTTVGDYGCLMLVRRSLARAGLRFSMHSLPTRMGRHLLVAHMVVNGESVRCAAWVLMHGRSALTRRSCSLPQLAIGTVHLESQANAAFRKQQLGVVWGVLSKADASHAVLCGDFNFSDGWPECRALDPAFQDVWLQLHPATAPECSYMTPPPGSADAGAWCLRVQPSQRRWGMPLTCV